MLSLSFSKLVSTPSESSWSQVYNAGNLFATLTLSKSNEIDDLPLNTIGKSIFSNLEAEFFTLEKKDLQNIKNAILKSLESIPERVDVDLTCAFFKENFLYIFISGRGKIIMRRDGKTGTLLENDSEDKKLLTASGILENNDLVILQTIEFANDVPSTALASALELEQPNDIAEALSPSMHEKDDGRQAAIIINYKTPTESTTIEDENIFDRIDTGSDKTEEELVNIKDPTIIEDVDFNESPVLNSEIDDKPEIPVHHYTENPATNTSFSLKLNRFVGSIFKKSRFSGMSHRRKFYLSIVIVIFIILATSIILAKQKQENSKTQELFESIYTPALKDYEDGKSIESINETFARDEFLSARNKLNEADGLFKKGSKEDKKIQELQAKIDTELGTVENTIITNVKEIKINSDTLLGALDENKSALDVVVYENSIYILTNDAIINIDNNKKIISNAKDWIKPVALSTYQGNFYVLDQENGIIKFTAGSDGFGKSFFFKTKPSNINDAVSMSIDGSIWVLFKDGTIFQYTKGESDGFRVKGLDKPFKNPAKIFTSADTESVYVLDNGNSRIVKLGKDGNFEEQYVTDIIKSAKAFEVQESNNKILILSGNKFWEIAI